MTSPQPERLPPKVEDETLIAAKQTATPSGQNLDDDLDRICMAHPEAMIPWYLCTSHLYYNENISVISDARYDELCQDLNDMWDLLNHPHKEFIDRDALQAGTGFNLSRDKLPNKVIGASMDLVKLLQEKTQ